MHTKISFRVTNLIVEGVLQEKKLSGSMSDYINKALIFYEQNAHEIAEIRQTLVQIKYMLAKMENAQKV